MDRLAGVSVVSRKYSVPVKCTWVVVAVDAGEVDEW